MTKGKGERPIVRNARSISGTNSGTRAMLSSGNMSAGGGNRNATRAASNLASSNPLARGRARKIANRANARQGR